MLFKIEGTLKELQSFYPHVPVVKASNEEYAHEKQNAVTNGLIITAFSWYEIYWKKGSLFSVLQEEVKSDHFSINTALILKLTEFSDSIFSHLLHQSLYSLDWSIWNISTILNTFGLFMPEEWTNSIFFFKKRITSDPENSEYP